MSAREAVLAHLRAAIERGEYAVGGRLPSEASLGAEFGVSRSVVREALRGLQALGLTESRTGKGTFVLAAGPTFGAYTARDLLEVRRHVEVPTAEYAALRHQPEDLAELTGLIERMNAETGEAAWVALDTRFHIAVARASGNPVFGKVIEEIRDALADQSAFLNRLGDRREASNEEHARIVAAIGRGDRNAAAKAMIAHLERVEETLKKIVGGGAA